MSIWEGILIFWIVGVCLAMWKIWRPAYKVISAIDEHNILIVRPILSTITVTMLFTIMLPFMVLPLLIPNKLEIFLLGFIRGAKRIK